jgi:hypothetical protein
LRWLPLQSGWRSDAEAAQILQQRSRPCTRSPEAFPSPGQQESGVPPPPKGRQCRGPPRRAIGSTTPPSPNDGRPTTSRTPGPSTTRRTRHRKAPTGRRYPHHPTVASSVIPSPGTPSPGKRTIITSRQQPDSQLSQPNRQGLSLHSAGLCGRSR